MFHPYDGQGQGIHDPEDEGMACCTVTPDYSQRPTDCITQVSPAVIQSVVESRVEDGRLTIVLNSNDQVCQSSQCFTDMTAIATVIASKRQNVVLKCVLSL